MECNISKFILNIKLMMAYQYFRQSFRQVEVLAYKWAAPVPVMELELVDHKLVVVQLHRLIVEEEREQAPLSPFL